MTAAGLDYDRIQGEFDALARTLGWPKAATLKDLRHLFCTCLENAGMPEFYRKYLMGQSSGRAIIARYTHLNKLREHFLRAVNTEMSSLVAAVDDRMHELSM